MGKKIDPQDIVGRQYGKWTVAEYSGKKGRDHLYGCVCECGAQKDVLRRSLLNGKSKSCGCGKTEPRTNRDEIVGNRYGHLTVLEFSHATSKGLSYKCRCDCGNIVIEQKSHLLHQKNITCGNCTKIVREGDHMKYICAKGDSFIFDYGDLDVVQSHRWCVADGYVECVSDGKLLKLTRLLLPCSKNMKVDHINGDTCDNRRCNLRIATSSENTGNAVLYSSNTTGYKGVSWNKQRKKYSATITKDREIMRLGFFETPEEAARAYDEAARFYFGEFACVNFPLPGEQGCRRNEEREVLSA